MGVSKVDFAGNTLVDLTGDSVTPDTLLEGATAHNAAGDQIAGAMKKGTELKLIVTVTSGATVTATKGSLSVSGTAINGTCTLTVPEAGTWSVKAVVSGETLQSEVVVSASTKAVLASAVLNNCSWETIRKVSDMGLGENYWSIGDRKSVTLNGTVGILALSNYTCYAFIIGFNHNAELEGTNRIHFQLAKTALSGGEDIALCDSKYGVQFPSAGFIMNSTSTNAGGWRDSEMRTKICGTSLSNYSGTMISVIPSDLRAALKSVTKYTDNVGGGSSTRYESSVTATTDYFFLLSEYEVRGDISSNEDSSPNPYEPKKQKWYAYYAAGNNPSKRRYDKLTEYATWWLRTPTTGYYGAGGFSMVVNTYQTSSVTYNASSCKNDFGLVACFCV